MTTQNETWLSRLFLLNGPPQIDLSFDCYRLFKLNDEIPTPRNFGFGPDDVTVLERTFSFQAQPSEDDIHSVIRSTEEWFVISLLSYALGRQFDCFLQQVFDSNTALRREHDYGIQGNVENRSSVVGNQAVLVHFLEFALKRFRRSTNRRQSRLARALNFYLRGFRGHHLWSEIAEIYMLQFTAFDILVGCLVERFEFIRDPLMCNNQWQDVRQQWVEIVEHHVPYRARAEKVENLFPQSCRIGTMQAMREIVPLLGLNVKPSVVSHLQRLRSKLVHEGILPNSSGLPSNFLLTLRNAVDRLVPLVLEYDNKFSKGRWETRSRVGFDRFVGCALRRISVDGAPKYID